MPQPIEVPAPPIERKMTKEDLQRAIECGVADILTRRNDEKSEDIGFIFEKFEDLIERERQQSEKLKELDKIWLLGDSFWLRSFSIWGHFMVAHFTIAILVTILVFLFIYLPNSI